MLGPFTKTRNAEGRPDLSRKSVEQRLQRVDLVAAAHRLSCPVACGIVPDEGSYLCPWHWQADFQLLDHQLLQVLFTMEERERILSEARKHVRGVDGRPTLQPNLIDEGFPLTRPQWDFERAEGREHLRVYRQTLMAGLRAAAQRPRNLAKIKLFRDWFWLWRLNENYAANTIPRARVK
ncbi:uncharacterized protein LOC129556281 [Moschus berezovskii]|uniref:uncharacterized protein LOC129556281 n=1 Tax=Moschus berezovskii TaxID=68408 RepID=UPI0024444CFC|nr:uncharacterized protein LOC129556281 [Moschus berezovskii]